MTNKQLDQMVNALVNGDTDKAKEHLNQYFITTTARIIGQQDQNVEVDPSIDTTQGS